MDVSGFTSNPNLAWLLAAVAALAAVLPQVRSFWKSLVGLVVVEAKLSESATDMFMAHAWDALRLTPVGTPFLSAYSRYLRPLERYGLVPVQVMGRESSITFLSGPFPVTVKMSKPEGGVSGITSVFFIRGTFNLTRFLIEAAAAQNAPGLQRRRFYTRRVHGTCGRAQAPGQPPPEAKPETKHWAENHERYLGWNREDIGTPVPTRPFEFLSYPQEVMELVEELRHWVGAREWHRARGLLHRLGVLVYGPPGTGKTSLARGLGQELDLPIHTYDLTTMNNLELASAWRESLTEAPVIVLLEDLDRTFEPDKDGRPRTPVTLDALLNLVAGVEPSEGILLIATANDPMKLAEALGVPLSLLKPPEGGSPPDEDLSTRPGRFDRFLFLGPLAVEQRRPIAERILADARHLVEEVVRKGEGDTAAQFTDRCGRLAKHEFWRRGSQAPRVL